MTIREDSTCGCGLYIHPTRRNPQAIHCADCKHRAVATHEMIKYLGNKFALDEVLTFSVQFRAAFPKPGYYACAWSPQTDWKDGPYLTEEAAEEKAKEYARKAFGVTL